MNLYKVKYDNDKYQYVVAKNFGAVQDYWDRNIDLYPLDGIDLIETDIEIIN